MIRPGPWVAGILLAWLASSEATDTPTGPYGVVDLPTLQVRREYNQLAAAIDTIVRVYGHKQLSDLAGPERLSVDLPEGVTIKLVFWADDEAQLFLNGNPVGETRLTPTSIDIPVMYLEEDNELAAHCWDTDRVESGFMAGLYVEDGAGGLHPVLTTQADGWKAGDNQAQEIFYSHTQPDIPEARILWGERLFGEVWLSAHFSAAAVVGAAQTPAVSATTNTWDQSSMHFHDVVSRLVQLQRRRRILGETLAMGSQRLDPHLRYRGPSPSQLAFTLGRVAPLADRQNLELSTRVVAWMESLPSREQELVMHAARRLKGRDAMIPGETFHGAAAAAPGDRQADYQPPPDRGPVTAGIPAVGRQAGRVVSASRRPGAWMWMAALALTAYLSTASSYWWRLYNTEVWTS